jgi:hypothetical protein
LTALQGPEIERIPLTLLGTYSDFAGPGHDIYVVKLEGERAEHIGVAGGMSGSPVYIDGQLIGALAYRLGPMPKEPIAGVTPIGEILDAARAGSVQPPSDDDVTPITTPVAFGGLVGPVREWLDPQFASLGFTITAGGRSDGTQSSAPIEPGSPIGIGLIRGDLTAAATGTVTWVDGERVYAFGHPFFSSGRSEMPMLAAEVLYTLSDQVSPGKLTMVGEEIGAIVEDRLTAVVGLSGSRAAMIPVVLKVEGGQYEKRTFNYEVVRNSSLAPLLTATAVANSLLANLGHDNKTTMLARGTAKLKDLPDLPFEMAFSGAAGANPGISLATNLAFLLRSIWDNRLGEVGVEGIELEVTVTPEILSYRVEGLVYDRGPVRPGEQLELGCLLAQYQGETITKRLTVALPSDLTDSESLILAVGPPTLVDRSLDDPVSKRVQTAKDLASVVRTLGELRSPNRLVAVLYRRASGVVSRGEVLADLPPTVAHLLSGRRVAAPANRTRVAVLSRTEIELDGPILGGVAVRLELDAALAGVEAEVSE